jgi:predicted alpha/beta hydrolase family esterase
VRCSSRRAIRKGPSFPDGPDGLRSDSNGAAAVPSIVVASADDQYVTMERAREYAAAWGSELVDLGEAGHINAASGLGSWAVGYGLLQRLRTFRGSANPEIRRSESPEVR